MEYSSDIESLVALYWSQHVAWQAFNQESSEYLICPWLIWVLKGNKWFHSQSEGFVFILQKWLMHMLMWFVKIWLFKWQSPLVIHDCFTEKMWNGQLHFIIYHKICKLRPYWFGPGCWSSQFNLHLVESKLLMTLKHQTAIYPFLDNN